VALPAVRWRSSRKRKNYLENLIVASGEIFLSHGNNFLSPDNKKLYDYPQRYHQQDAESVLLVERSASLKNQQKQRKTNKNKGALQTKTCFCLFFFVFLCFLN